MKNHSERGGCRRKGDSRTIRRVTSMNPGLGNDGRQGRDGAPSGLDLRDLAGTDDAAESSTRPDNLESCSSGVFAASAKDSREEQTARNVAGFELCDDTGVGNTPLPRRKPNLTVSVDRRKDPPSATKSCTSEDDQASDSGIDLMSPMSTMSNATFPPMTNMTTALDEMVDLLAKDPDLIQIVERGLAAIITSPAQLYDGDSESKEEEEDSKLPATISVDRDEISRRVVRAILEDNNVKRVLHERDSQLIREQRHRGRVGGHGQNRRRRRRANTSDRFQAVSMPASSSMRSSSISRSPSPLAVDARTARGTRGRMMSMPSPENAPPPVKSVSFSSVSAPDFDMVDNTGNDDEYHNYPRASSSSPPPPQFPALLQEASYARGRGSGSHSAASSAGNSVGAAFVSSPIRSRSQSRSRSPAARATFQPLAQSVISVDTGETTASGDSSVGSFYTGTSIRTTSEPPSVTFADSAVPTATATAAASQPQVHFSAMNPNPQLVLDGHNTAAQSATQSRTTAASSAGSNPATPRVSFTVDRAVSWEDQFHRDAGPTIANSSSRASIRSGLSSPSIEPALSPLSRSRSPSQIQFNSAIETITEAAARLRSQQHNDRRESDDNTNISSASTVAMASSEPLSEEEGRRSSSARQPAGIVRPTPRLVHFSAMRDIAVVNTNEAAASSLNAGGILGAASSQNDQHQISIQDLTGLPSRNPAVAATSSGSSSVASSGVRFATDSSVADRVGMEEDISHIETEMEQVANRLRQLICRAEEVGGVTLESSFVHFDRRHTGIIRARDLQEGITSLGESFANLSLEECSVLLACLTKRDRGQKISRDDQATGINLLGFYRAMGRSSPPLLRTGSPPPFAVGTNGQVGLETFFGERGEGNGDEDDNYEADTGGERSIVGTTLHQHSANRSDGEMIDLATSSVVHAHDAAARLRALVLSAEEDNGFPLESSFRLFDPSQTGYIAAHDFRMGLRRLGRIKKGENSDANGSGTESTDVDSEIDGDFSSINDDDCEELVALFDKNKDGLVSLLDFYRFMGRHSPPPETRTTSNDNGGLEESDDESELGSSQRSSQSSPEELPGEDDRGGTLGASNDGNNNGSDNDSSGYGSEFVLTAEGMNGNSNTVNERLDATYSGPEESLENEIQVGGEKNGGSDRSSSDGCSGSHGSNTINEMQDSSQAREENSIAPSANGQQESLRDDTQVAALGAGHIGNNDQSGKEDGGLRHSSDIVMHAAAAEAMRGSCNTVNERLDESKRGNAGDAEAHSHSCPKESRGDHNQVGPVRTADNGCNYQSTNGGGKESYLAAKEMNGNSSTVNERLDESKMREECDAVPPPHNGHGPEESLGDHKQVTSLGADYNGSIDQSNSDTISESHGSGVVMPDLAPEGMHSSSTTVNRRQDGSWAREDNNVVVLPQSGPEESFREHNQVTRSTGQNDKCGRKGHAWDVSMPMNGSSPAVNERKDEAKRRDEGDVVDGAASHCAINADSLAAAASRVDSSGKSHGFDTVMAAFTDDQMNGSSNELKMSEEGDAVDGVSSNHATVAEADAAQVIASSNARMDRLLKDTAEQLKMFRLNPYRACEWKATHKKMRNSMSVCEVDGEHSMCEEVEISSEYVKSRRSDLAIPTAFLPITIASSEPIMGSRTAESNSYDLLVTNDSIEINASFDERDDVIEHFRSNFSLDETDRESSGTFGTQDRYNLPGQTMPDILCGRPECGNQRSKQGTDCVDQQKDENRSCEEGSERGPRIDGSNLSAIESSEDGGEVKLFSCVGCSSPSTPETSSAVTRHVQFSEVLVSAEIEGPSLELEDLKCLYYSQSELNRFEKDFEQEVGLSRDDSSIESEQKDKENKSTAAAEQNSHLGTDYRPPRIDTSLDENKVACKIVGRRVQFLDHLVSEVRERPRTHKRDIRALYYSASDLDRFEDEADDDSILDFTEAPLSPEHSEINSPLCTSILSPSGKSLLNAQLRKWTR